MTKQEIIRLIDKDTAETELNYLLGRYSIIEVAQKITTASKVACDCIERAYEENATINGNKIECPRCGNELKVLPKYCPYCGQHIRNGNEEALEEAYQKGREDVLEEVENLKQRIADICKEMER